MRKFLMLAAITAISAPAFADTVHLPADLSGYFNRLRMCKAGVDDPHLMCSQLPEERAAMEKRYAEVPKYLTLLAAYN